MHKHAPLTLVLGMALQLGCTEDGESPLPPVDAGFREDVPADVPPPPPPPPRFEGAFRTTVPAAPRPLAPLAASNVTTQRPTLRWSRPLPWAATELELCGDRACQTVEQRVRVEGTTWRPETPLRPGPHHWRLWGLTADGARSAEHSHTWTLQVPGRDTDVDSAHLPQTDLDGDGYADLFVQGDTRAAVYFGSAQGLSLDGVVVFSSVAPEPPSGFSLFQSSQSLWGVGGLGDLNGDGTSEFFVMEGFGYANWDEGVGYSFARLVIMTLSPDRQPVTLLTMTTTSEDEYTLPTLRGGFDADDDGYGDLLVHQRAPGPQSFDGVTVTEAPVLHGRAEGAPVLSDSDAPPDIPMRGMYGSTYVPLGDVNGDGRIDHAVFAGGGLSPAATPRLAYTLFPGRAAHSFTFDNVPLHECNQVVLASRRCDLNGDGRADHFRISDLCRDQRRVSVQLGQPGDRGAYVALAETPEVRASAIPTCLGDLDGDGRSEIGWVDTGNVGTLYSLTDDYQLTPWAQSVFGNVPADMGDADGDGRAEVVTRIAGNDALRVCHPTRAAAAGDCQTLRLPPSFGLVRGWNP